MNSELRREVHNSEARFKKSAEELQVARAENEGLEEAVKEVNRRLHEKNVANNQLVEKTQGLEEMVANLKEKLQEMQAKHGALEQQKNNLQEKFKKSEEFGKGKMDENKELRREVQNSNTKIKKMSERAQELSEVLKSTREDARQFRDRANQLQKKNEKFEANFMDHILTSLYVAAAFVLVMVYLDRVANSPIQSKSGEAQMAESGSGAGKKSKEKKRKKALDAIVKVNEQVVERTFVNAPIIMAAISFSILGFAIFQKTGFVEVNYAW